MTTLFHERGSYVDSGEALDERRDYVETVLNAIAKEVGGLAVTHYSDEATGADQFPFTD